MTPEFSVKVSAFSIALFVPTHQNLLGAHPYLFRKPLVVFPVDREAVPHFESSWLPDLVAPFELFYQRASAYRPSLHIVYSLGQADYLAYLACWEHCTCPCLARVSRGSASGFLVHSEAGNTTNDLSGPQQPNFLMAREGLNTGILI